MSKQDDIIQAYKHIFANELAGTVLEDLKVFCGYDSKLFVPGMADMTAYALGVRAAYLHIQEMINIKVEDTKSKKTITENPEENERK